MTNNSHSFWRFRPGRATYVGRLERKAAREEMALTYEREWHDSFVNGRRNCALVNGGGSHGLDRLFALGSRDMEFRPELPAPRSRPPRANPFYAVSAENDNTALNPADPNYFSDPESERTVSVAEEYKAAELAERAASAFGEEKSDQEFVAQKRNQSRPFTRKNGKLAQEQQQISSTAREMAGRGRGRPGGNLKGITWEYDPSIKLESKPIELFPPHPNLKRPAPLTDQEKREISQYKRLQSQVHRGPLYTQPTKRDATAPAKTFGEDQFNRQYSTNPKADFDPFTGVETYSQRLQPKANEIPKLSGRPFNKDLFPKELWPALEGEAGNDVRKHLDRANEKKSAIMAGMKEKKPDDKHARVLEKLFSVPVDEDAEEVDEEQEQDAEVDSNFDDESMGGDYDAEQYFDNGEDNSEGEGGGGEEDY